MRQFSEHPLRPIAVVEEQLAHCRRDRAMRSVTACIRLSREQIAARDSARGYLLNSLFMASLAACLVPTLTLMPDKRTGILVMIFGVLAIASFFFVGFLFSLAHLRDHMMEKARIRTLLFEILEDLARDPKVRLERLDKVERRFLRRQGIRTASPTLQQRLLN